MNLSKPTEISNIVLLTCLLVPMTDNVSAATKLSAYPISGQVSLKWSTTANTLNYQLCYASQPIKDMSVCTSYTNGVSILTKANKYTVTKLADGTTYYFKIAALNENSNILSSSKSLAIIPQPLLNDTGILKNQCYQAASNTLIDCDNTAAKNLSTKQDGSTGNDSNGVINSDADGFKGFNFTKIDSNGLELPKTAKSWSCIKDNGTGLVWEVKAADGGLRDKQKVYTNYSTASGISTDANVFVQQVNSQGLCGATDWRLPKAHELQSLLNYSVAYPTPMIDTVFLPNSLGTQYWSSSPNTDNADYAWFVNFSDGRVSNSDRFRQYAVRLVRGTPYAPATRFTASSDGQEVTDNKTRLIWRRCSEGLTWNGATCTGTLQFYNYESALTRAATEASASSKAWRLPNIKELASISDIARNPDPAIDLAVFPGTPSERYWASTPFLTNPAFAWYGDFYDGYLNYSLRTSSFAVRLVRN